MNSIQVQLKNQSLIDILDTYPDLMYLDWYRKEPFAQKKHTGMWEVTPQIEGSTNNTWDEQLKLIPEGQEVPPAVVLVVALIHQYGITGERLLSSTYSRTSDVLSDGRRVEVGVFDALGLRVSYWYDRAYDDDFIGVSSARKLKKLNTRNPEPVESLPLILEINGKKYRQVND